MAQRITLDEQSIESSVQIAAKCIRDGYVVVAPHDNGYVLLSDAFSHDAVRSLHAVRESELGVAAQVLLHDQIQVDGIARGIGDDAKLLMSTFWPGPLSLSLRPQPGLSWNLGDGGKLDLVNIRIPKNTFLQTLLKESGPLAVASASTPGTAPLLDLANLQAQDYEVALIVNSGVLLTTQPSTVLEITEEGMKLVREGAISRDEIEKVIPSVIIG
jgi:tRNA threonylcarbamoyl adenosine modification protein (Sua5/YciO/YrdC/YwlC family)